MQDASLTWLLVGALVPHHVGISTRLSECLQMCHLASPRAIDGKKGWRREGEKEKDKTTLAFYDLVSRVLYCLFCFVLSTGSELLNPAMSQGEENYFPPLKRKTIKEFVDIFFNWT